MKKAFQIITVLLLASALVVSAGASSFTPSVEQKGAPTVVVEGTTKEVTIVPIADAEKAPDEIKSALEEAYKNIETADSLVEAAPALLETLKVVAPEVKAEDLVVRDLMYVGVELDEGEKVVLKFDLKVEKNDVIIPMLFIDGEWVPVDPELVTINEDGTVSIEFSGTIGIIAFVTVKAE